MESLAKCGKILALTIEPVSENSLAQAAGQLATAIATFSVNRAISELATRKQFVEMTDWNAGMSQSIWS
jgi:hypothetical protein